MNNLGDILLGLAVLVVAAGIVGGIGSCVRRDWQYEDACRRAGGTVTNGSRIGAGGTTGQDVCVRAAQTPVLQMVPLPEYRR